MVSAGLCTRGHGYMWFPALVGELDTAGASGAGAACPAGRRRMVIDLAAPEFTGCYTPCALQQGQNLAREAVPAVLASPQEDVLRVVGLATPVGVFCVRPGIR